MRLTDLWFAHRARSGDRKAFDTLFRRHAPRIYNLLRRLGANPSDAEDLAQETFVSAYRALTTWRSKGSFSTWLCSIAINAYRNRYRSMRREADDEPLDGAIAATEECDPLSRYTKAEARDALTRAIVELPTASREAFVLVYVEEFSYKEAADLLEIPVGTVQSRLNRAKRLLHARLSEHSVNEPESVAIDPSSKGVNLHVIG